ncbi:hypothetical protein PQR71_18000 [Paraburkholderia fungorum]|uniref:hypothetical protein n=1 Tax=Paraburkholderia fungorum TaxID=134537 RepID=UPI0038BB86EA
MAAPLTIAESISDTGKMVFCSMLMYSEKSFYGPLTGLSDEELLAQVEKYLQKTYLDTIRLAHELQIALPRSTQGLWTDGGLEPVRANLTAASEKGM